MARKWSIHTIQFDTIKQLDNTQNISVNRTDFGFGIKRISDKGLEDDKMKLLHELQVHQLELEAQNRELRPDAFKKSI